MVKMVNDKDDNVSKDAVQKPAILFQISSKFLLFFFAFGLTIVLWSVNLTLRIFVSPSGEPVSPVRFLVSVLFPLLIATIGIKKKSVSKSGAILGFIFAFILTIANYMFLICLFTFFVSSSKATKYKSKEKKKLEHDFKEGGQRNWVQVLCNGGMATSCAIFYIFDSGCSEIPIDFSRYFRASWISLGVLGAFACANGDTWASELGSVLSKSNPRLITTWNRVPKGVNGGVSMAGLLLSFLGGLTVGLSYCVCLPLLTDISDSPPQYPIIFLAGAAGFIGSLIDSILGATIQFSGINKKTGVVVDTCGKDVEHISGLGLLDNNSVNLLSTVIMAFLTPRMASLFWN